jgi:hypothetical protein
MIPDISYPQNILTDTSISTGNFELYDITGCGRRMIVSAENYPTACKLRLLFVGYLPATIRKELLNATP